MFVDFHDRRLVTASVAVVGCREDGNNISVLRPIIALHHELMSTCNKRETVVMVERLRDVLAEGVASTTGRDSPAAAVIGVGPEQVTHGTLVGHLLDSVERSDVVKGIDTRGQAAVQAENLIVDEGSKGEVVEEIGEILPHVSVAIFPEALVIKAIDLGDLAGLVVATEDGDALRISDLEGDEESHSLDGIVASVDVVTHEEVVGVWVGTAN